MSTENGSRNGQLLPGDLAPDAIVLDAAGHPRSLAETWRSGPIVLTFLRHFG